MLFCDSCVFLMLLSCLQQRWARLTAPVWGPHHLEYMAPDMKSLTPLSPGSEDNKVIIFESVM